ncbi:hypothetical protein OIU77_001905 [Salix suchowensis]|uniref:DM2 domain-containing protein n=1 Tax=Salix suchowensis TaxID=1278906 RepID=A0ABQ9B622_9ROSI|nr:hypothetical protein OIU77_001905 [Salix suchowensis]
MPLNNNNNNLPNSLGQSSSPLANSGMVNSSMGGNPHFSQAQGQMGAGFQGGQFQLSQAQATVQAHLKAQQAHAHAQAVHASQIQAAHVQLQAQLQAQGISLNQTQNVVIGNLGSSSPSFSTPGNASANRPPQKPMGRPPGVPILSMVSPLKPMDLSSTARRKKQKLHEKQLQDRVAAILPESALYTQLLEFEACADAALARKKVDIQEALKSPPCVQKTLRIYVFNTFANQIRTIPNKLNAEPPTWTLKRVTIQLDQRLYPDNHIIIWEHARSPAPHEGFEVKRKGDKELTVNIRLEMNYLPEKFKLSPALMEVLGVEVETRPRIIAAIWHYVKARKLQNPDDPSFFICDAPLQKVFGESKMKFTMVSQRISPHLSPPQPIHLEHKIKLSGNSPAGTVCYDVLVDVPFPIQRELYALLANAEKNKEIDTCDEAICTAIRKIHEHRRRRAFFLGFSQSPVEFVNALIESQSKDLGLVAGEASRNAENEHHSNFFNQPWVEDAVIRYLNRKPAVGSDAPGST